MEAVIVTVYKLKQEETGKIVYLLGDISVPTLLDDNQKEFITNFLDKCKDGNNFDIFIDNFTKPINSGYGLTNNLESSQEELVENLRNISNMTDLKQVFQNKWTIFYDRFHDISQSAISAIVRPNIKFLISKLFIQPDCLLARLKRDIRDQSDINVIEDPRYLQDINITNNLASSPATHIRQNLLNQNIPGVTREEQNELLGKLYKNEYYDSNERSQFLEKLDFQDLSILDKISHSQKNLIAIISFVKLIKLKEIITSGKLNYKIEDISGYEIPNKELSRFLVHNITKFEEPFIDSFFLELIAKEPSNFAFEKYINLQGLITQAIKGICGDMNLAKIPEILN